MLLFRSPAIGGKANAPLVRALKKVTVYYLIIMLTCVPMNGTMTSSRVPKADPQEQYPLSIASDPAASAALASIIAAAKDHVAGVSWEYGDGLTLEKSSDYLLCCNRTAGCKCNLASKCL